MDGIRRDAIPYTGEPLTRNPKPRPEPRGDEGPLHLRLFGTLSLAGRAEEKTAFSTRKVGLILAYLGLEPGKPVAREWLRELFWPDADEAAGRNALSVALSRLRADLGISTILQSDRWTVALDAERIDSDVRRFRAALRGVSMAHTETGRMAQAIRALREYRGPLLPGCDEPWALGERTSLGESHYRAVVSLLDYLEVHGDLNGGVGEVEAALPLLDEHRQGPTAVRLKQVLRTMPQNVGTKFLQVARPTPTVLQGDDAWDAARDFSSESNPNGVWSYGWSWSEDGPMQPAPFSDRLWSGEIWVPLWRAAMYAYPCIAKNEAHAPFVYETLTVRPGSLMMHPGPVGQVAVLRWTAPATGRYELELQIYSIAPDATTGVCLRSPHGLLWRHEYRTLIEPEIEFTHVLELAEGAWVEVRVDDGGDDYISDSTGIHFAVRLA